MLHGHEKRAALSMVSQEVPTCRKKWSSLKHKKYVAGNEGTTEERIFYRLRVRWRIRPHISDLRIQHYVAERMSLAVRHSSLRFPVGFIHLHRISIIGMEVGNRARWRLHGFDDIDDVLVTAPWLEELVVVPHTDVVCGSLRVVQTHIHVEVLDVIPPPSQTPRADKQKKTVNKTRCDCEVVADEIATIGMIVFGT